MKAIKYIAVVGTTMALVACGGDDNENGGNNPIPDEPITDITCMQGESFTFADVLVDVPASEVDTDGDGCVTGEEWQAAYARALEESENGEMVENTLASTDISNRTTADAEVYLEITAMTITGSGDLIADGDTDGQRLQIPVGDSYTINVQVDSDTSYANSGSSALMRVILSDKTATEFRAEGGQTGTHIFTNTPTDGITLECSYSNINDISCDDVEFSGGRFSEMATPAGLNYIAIACNGTDCTGSIASVPVSFQ